MTAAFLIGRLLLKFELFDSNGGVDELESVVKELKLLSTESSEEPCLFNLITAVGLFLLLFILLVT